MMLTINEPHLLNVWVVLVAVQLWLMVLGAKQYVSFKNMHCLSRTHTRPLHLASYNPLWHSKHFKLAVDIHQVPF